MTKIFKFRNGTFNAKDENLDLLALENDYLWFSSLKDFNDPYEGWFKLTNNNVSDDLRIKFIKSDFYNFDGLSEIDSERKALETYMLDPTSFSKDVDSFVLKYISELKDKYSQENGFCSFSMGQDDHNNFPTPINNMLMWAHYSNGFRGFCLEFDLEELISSINSNGCEVNIHSVKYNEKEIPNINMSDVYQDLIEDNNKIISEMARCFATKSESWNYEREIRVTCNKGKVKYNRSSLKKIFLSELAPEKLKDSIFGYVFNNPNVNLVIVSKDASKYGFGYKFV